MLLILFLGEYMKKLIAIVVLVVGSSGCVFAGGKGDNGSSGTGTRSLPSSYAIPGTSTAIVGIGVDKKGIPLETVKEIVLLPGQRVVFAGPDRFQIKFKKDKSPSGQVNYESKNGVIAIVVPKDIFGKAEFSREEKEKKYLRFDYSIFVNGKELDPPLIVKRGD